MAFPSFPVSAGPGTPCDAVSHNGEYFLRLFDRNLPIFYLVPIKQAANGGYELFEGFSLVGERVSSAIHRFECGSLIIYAEGGSFATGEVEFYRATVGVGAFVIKAGTVVTTSQNGRDFITTTDVEFGAFDVGPITCPVRSVAQGWEWNVRGQRTTATGVVLPGEIDTIKRIITAASATDGTFVFEPELAVRQVLDTDSGRAPMLDGIGDDLNLPRRDGEGDKSYRLRLRTLPDTVSPGAINRFVQSLIQQFPTYTFEFIETFDIRYQTCWDAPPAAIPANPNYDPNLFCYDDPRPIYGPGPGHPVPPGAGFYNRWLDELEARGAFIVVVPPLAAISDVGMGYDDTAMDPSGHISPGTGGRRAHAAYDVPPDVDSSLILQGGYDGFDLGVQSIYASIWETLQQIKAAGVAAIVELQGQ